LITADGSDFSSAARGALQFLRTKFDFDLWMVTRTQGEDWIVLEADDQRYGIGQHACFQWADSYCSRMVSGHGPRIAPNSASIPAYASARFGELLSIGAYIGVPLTYQDGGLFGTLCAIDPKPQPDSIEEELPLVEMVATMLSGVLAAELRAVEAEREKERSLVEVERDALTGLFNRRGWDRMLAAEQERCRRYGNAACVILVDLDGLKTVNETRGHAAGDKLIRRAGKVLVKTLRESDVVARLGGSDFGVLGIQCDLKTSELILRRIQKALEQAGVTASVGMSSQVPGIHLTEQWREANQLLYADKISRKMRKTVGDLRRISRAQTFPFEEDSPGTSVRPLQ
jgi:diguanylate cyclase